MNTGSGLCGEVRVGFGKRSGSDLLGIRGQRLYLRCLRTYSFAADEVVSIERRESSWLDAGVRLVHSRPDYPRHMTFRCRDGSDEVYQLLARAGFVPNGTVPAGRSSLIPAAHALGVAIAIYALSALLVRLLR